MYLSDKSSQELQSLLHESIDNLQCLKHSIDELGEGHIRVPIFIHMKSQETLNVEEIENELVGRGESFFSAE